MPQPLTCPRQNMDRQRPEGGVNNQSTNTLATTCICARPYRARDERGLQLHRGSGLVAPGTSGELREGEGRGEAKL